jgi:hypothetical protein
MRGQPVRRWFLLAVPCIAVVGLLGAGAFNPDGGWLLRSLLLYRAFGAPGEVALLLTPVVVVGVVIAFLRRSHRRH